MTQAHAPTRQNPRAHRAGPSHRASIALALLILALTAGSAAAQSVPKARAPVRPAPVAPVISDSTAPMQVIIPRQVAVPAPVAPVAPTQDAAPAPAPSPPVRVAPLRPGGPSPVAPGVPVNVIEGTYSLPGSAVRIKVSHVLRDFYDLSSSDGWEGVGILEGTTYRGVFRQRATGTPPRTATGQHVIDWSDPAHPAVHIRLDAPQSGELDVRWQRVADQVVVAPPSPEELPKFGEYVYVEELPEVIERVAPTYPDAAREAGVQGTVQLQALVVQDGSVADCKITRSIPPLDAAAVASVRQWRFKPALAKGKPVAVWVAVPVKFSLH